MKPLDWHSRVSGFSVRIIHSRLKRRYDAGAEWTRDTISENKAVRITNQLSSQIEKLVEKK